MSRFARLEALYERYGPRRFPYADRPNVAAGYGMAMAAAIGSAVFFVLLQTLGEIVSPWTPAPGNSAFAQVGWLAPTVPMAFLAGIVVWRFLPIRRWQRGWIGGLLAMCLMYPLSVVVTFFGLAVFSPPSQWIHRARHRYPPGGPRVRRLHSFAVAVRSLIIGGQLLRPFSLHSSSDTAALSVLGRGLDNSVNSF